MTVPNKITIILAEDHAVVRQGLCSLLNEDPRFNIVGEARNGREAVEMAHRLQPDVILMDIAMPTLNGLDATRQILAANASAKVIILSAHTEDEYVDRLSDAGVLGFLEKQATGDCLTRAICDVAKGNTSFSPSISKRMADLRSRPQRRDGVQTTKRLKLTRREVEVLQLVAEGAPNKTVATELGISIKTVEKHRQQIMDKLGIHHTAGLTKYAISVGVIEGGAQLTII